MAVGKQMSLEFKDFNQVANVYMDFVVDGGFFIPTNQPFEMGQEIFIALTLPDDPERRVPAATKVVWITPPNATKSKPGIGVQLIGANAKNINTRLKNCVEKSTRRSPYTFTM